MESYINRDTTHDINMMTSRLSSPYIFFALLIYDSSGTPCAMNNCALNPSYCTTSSSSAYKYYRYYDKLLATSYTLERGFVLNFTTSYDTLAYVTEGVRMEPNGNCIVCPYDNDENPNSYWTSVLGGVGADPLLGDDEHRVMYGPCFNGDASLPMTCIQHPFLFPPEIFGTFYYPPQRAVRQLPNNEITNIATHLFLNDNSLSNYDVVTGPSNYGLGEGRIKNYWLYDIGLFNTSTETVNTELMNFLSPYVGEYWPAWAQFYCSPGCHRDASYVLRNFRSSDDYGNNPKYDMIQRFFDPNTGTQPMCIRCPPGTAVDHFRSIGRSPMNIALAAFGPVCRPWFGALPTVNSDGGLHYTTDAFPASYRVVSPSVRYTYPVASFCPVNTFNRICALTQAFMDTPTCTPCASGWHTAGATGAWFCLPPAGQIFSEVTRRVLSTDASAPWVNGTQWRYRDLWRYELECGPSYDYCQQCERLQCTDADTCTPDYFNEKYIFDPFFALSPCPTGSYCPDAVTVLACPFNRAYSPVGSSVLSNCTCTAGLWWNGTDCVPCTSSCAVPGTYLPLSACMNLNGAQADGTCRNCSNYDPASMLPLTSTGYEYSSSVGLCSFTCRPGYQYSSFYACVPMTKVMRLATGISYYSTNVGSTWNDGFACFIGASGSLMLNPILQLTNAIAAANNLLKTSAQTAGWSSNPLTCSPTSPSGIPQYLGDYMGFAVTPCKPCPFSAPPANGTFAQMTTYTLAGCDASPTCTSGTYYLNRTLWACFSCADRARLVCPSSQYFIQGGGCGNIWTPLNTVNASADCTTCSIDVATLTPGVQYLMKSAAGCHAESCAQLATNQYWSTPCEGTNPGVSATCRSSTSPCQSGYYLSDPSKTCGPTSPWICSRCQYEGLAGFWYNASTNCTNFADVRLSTCPANSFCVGGTTLPQACPIGMLSNEGATSLAECYCPIGQLISINSVTQIPACVPLICNGTTSIATIPGSFSTSPYYIYQDPLTETSSCIACGSGALAKGTTFTVDACRCVQSNTYPFVSGSGVQCMPCPVTTDWSSFCSAATLTPAMYEACGVHHNACNRPLPPFSSASPSSPYYTCNSGFVATPSNNNGLIDLPPSLSGSSLYATATAWSMPYDPLSFSTCNPGAVELAENLDVSHIAVSSTNPQNLNAEPPPLVFWTVAEIDAGKAASVYSSSLQQSTRCLDSGSGYSAPSWIWQVVPEDSSSPYTYTIDAIVTSPWILTGLGATYTLSVAVVVRRTTPDAATRTFSLQIISPSVSASNYAQSYVSLPSVSTVTTQSLPTLSGASVVSLSHLQQSPLGSLFVLAYNSPSSLSSPCGIIFIQQVDPSISSTSYPCSDLASVVHAGGLLSVTTSSASSTAAMIFMVYADYPHKVFQSYVTSVSGSVVLTSPVEWAVHASSGAISSIVALWSGTSTPMLLAIGTGTPTCDPRGLGGDNSASCILVADSVERTLVPVQGLPFGSTATLLAGGSLTSSSSSDAIVVAATAKGIFSIATSKCPNAPTLQGVSITQYWTGSTCTPQLCLRPPPCSSAAYEVSDGTACQCMPGYYRPGVQCITCQYGPYYCPGGDTRRACGSSLTTWVSNPTSYSQCLCGTGAYFTGSSCELCTLPYYCPDLWNRYRCPSSNLQASSMALSVSTPTTPVYCACASGYYGPGCIPCPSGYYCQESTTKRWNSARLFNVITSSNGLSAGTLDALSNAIRSSLLAYYSAPTNVGLVYGTDPSEYAYVQVTNSSHSVTTSITYHVMVMVQQTRDSSGWTDAVTGYQSYATNTGGLVTGISTSTQYSLAVNMINVAQPALCPSGQTPNPAASDCMCKAGSYVSSHTSSSMACSLCPQGTYQSEANTDTVCKICTGNVTNADVGATACDIPITTSVARVVTPSHYYYCLLVTMLLLFFQ